MTIQSLKPFQQATVSAAIAAFEHPPLRFLIADEVGLGKTLVAQHIVDELAKKKRRGPLVVFYVCSNLTIACQNRKKLLDILPDKEDRKAARCKEDRLTMLLTIPRPSNHLKFHLYTLTPDTSIPVRSKSRRGCGRQEERALLKALLARSCPANFEWLKMRNLSNWDYHVGKYEDLIEREPGVLDAFRRSVLQEFGVRSLDKLPALFDDIKSTAHRKKQRFERILIPRLRNALALAALQKVQPDLVIFDEFQRFRDLIDLEVPRESKLLVERLRGDSHATRLLLLSATPYTLYVRRGQNKSFHEEFYDLIEFLHGSRGKEVRSECQAGFAQLEELIRKRKWACPDSPTIKERLEELLTPVMARTERASHELIADDVETEEREGSLTAADLEVFRHTSNCFARHKSAAVHYWYSIPLPVQTMGSNYVAWKSWRKGKHRVTTTGVPSFTRKWREKFRKVDWAHPRLRKLQEIAPKERLALPWLPPTLPWWPLKGMWKEASSNNDSISKILVFSRFRAVPPAISGFLSYDVESAYIKGRRYSKANKDNKFKPRPALLELFFPSPCLIQSTEPLEAGPLTPSKAEKVVERQLRQLFKKHGIVITSGKRKRKLWVLMVRLESRVGNWEGIRKAWQSMIGGKSAEAGLHRMLDAWNADKQQLEDITDAEIKALARVAISSPGIALGRAVYRHWKEVTSFPHFPLLLSTVWQGLRTYLDQNVFVGAFSRSGEVYPKTVQRLIVDGNFEAVMDEYLWLLKGDAEDASDLCSTIRNSLKLGMGRSWVYPLSRRSDEDFHLRCHTAMPFVSHDASQPREKTPLGQDEPTFRTDELRKAFNSPFWPHVLTTTSVGQEGLDFHHWCDTLVHWDLCGNPVDLEQREGRIQRFGGLAVRKSIAKNLRDEVLPILKPFESPWSQLAAVADSDPRLQDDSGLSPWWLAKDAKISRFVINLPASEEKVRLQRLKDHRRLYRLVLGQPNQEDLVEMLARDGEEHDFHAMRNLLLCLSPYFRSKGT